MSKRKAKDYAVIGGVALVGIYLLSMKAPGSNTGETVAEKAAYNVTKSLFETTGEAVGGTVTGAGGAIVEGWERGMAVFGIGDYPPPGTKKAVAVSISDPRLNLDFSKTTPSKIPNLTKKGGQLPESQPVVEQIKTQLRPGQGYILTPEEQAQFYDPFGDLQWEQYMKKRRR